MTAMDDLYAEYHQQVYRFAYWLCGNVHEAEDITSETFLRALTGADHVRAATVRAYLFTIARHLFLRTRRRDRRYQALDDSFVDASPGPATRAEDRRRLEQVMSALASLSPLDRAALLLRARDAMPYEEIGQVLGVSVSAAKVKVHRARLKLALSQKAHEVAP